MAKRTAFPSSSDGDGPSSLALVLTGGGARAAYQVGFLHGLAQQWPDLEFRVLTGVSAGAINAVCLAAHGGSFLEATADLAGLWRQLTVDRVFRVDWMSLLKKFVQWGLRLASGGSRLAPRASGLVDTSPLAATLVSALELDGKEIVGIRRNIAAGRLKGVALVTLDYARGQSVAWVEGRDIEGWQSPSRRSVHTRLEVRHVMASAALPLFFPAVRLDGAWHGDGGVRLSRPLSPALHLGAERLLAISPHHRGRFAPGLAELPEGEVPPAQILGQLVSAIFLDALSDDIERVQSLNRLLKKLPAEERGGRRLVDTLIVRPSEDLGALAADYEIELPRAFRFATRGLGTRQTRGADFLSLLMFQPEYLARLIEIGEGDALAKCKEIEALVAPATKVE